MELRFPPVVTRAAGGAELPTRKIPSSENLLSSDEFRLLTHPPWEKELEEEKDGEQLVQTQKIMPFLN